MKFKVLLLFLALTSFCFAENWDDRQENYFYFNIDIPFNIHSNNGVYTPFLGIGQRQIYGKNGLDINLSLEPYMIARSYGQLLCFQFSGILIRFDKYGKFDKFYCGIGANFLGIYCSDYFYLLRSPSFVIGRQFYHKVRSSFVHIKICWPNYPNIWIRDYYYRISKKDKFQRVWNASLSITYGLGF